MPGHLDANDRWRVVPNLVLRSHGSDGSAHTGPSDIGPVGFPPRWQQAERASRIRLVQPTTHRLRWEPRYDHALGFAQNALETVPTSLRHAPSSYPQLAPSYHRGNCDARSGWGVYRNSYTQKFNRYLTPPLVDVIMFTIPGTITGTLTERTSPHSDRFTVPHARQKE
jgi:hypothetical protein